MKNFKIIAEISLLIFSLILSSKTLAADLEWQTSKDTAFSIAISQNKKVLLLAGRDACGNCNYMKNTVFESAEPPIKELIEQNFILWFSDVDNSNEWYLYADGLGGFTLPLICIIDPNSDNIYEDRTTGIQYSEEFYSRLLQCTTDLIWYNSEATAFSAAISQNKKILLFVGRESSHNCNYMKGTVFESAEPPIKELIEQNFILWFSDVDDSIEWYPYADGLGNFYLPLLCVIDPSNDNIYEDRTTGIQYSQEFYDRLLPYTSDSEYWILISLFKQPANTSIDSVLEPISGKYISVWTYENGSWQVYDPANPGFSDLTTMEAGKGYWLHLSEPATLGISGDVPSNSITLTTGWNLVGYNSDTAQAVADALASIEGKYISVWAYMDGGWKVYDPANPGFSDLTIMEPGYGYWINASEACTWILS